MKTKKYLYPLLMLTMTVMLSGCGNKPVNDDTASSETTVSIANPWRDCTEEEAYEYTPNGFSAPDGATDERWSICETADDKELPGTMVQLTFEYSGLEYTARQQPVPGEEIVDISGLYYNWTEEEEGVLAHWGGGQMPCRICRYIGDDVTVDLCLWFDIETGYAYSLSTQGQDLDGFDIQAIAEAMYDPSKQVGANAPAADTVSDESTDFDVSDVAGDAIESVDKTGADSDSGKLPAFVYDGDADIAAICDYLINEIASNYDAADVTIPYMKVVDTDDSDPDDTKVWGDFWVINYDLNGDVLEMASGGNYPGLMHLKKNSDGSCVVTEFEQVADGSDFIPSAKKIFGDRYDDFIKAQSDDKAMEEIRAEYIRGYVEANGLNITAYKDYGWDPVDLGL